MEFKKNTKKRFSLIERIFMKNAVNRIEDLEENTNALEEKTRKYVTVIEDFSTAVKEIDVIKSAILHIIKTNPPSGNMDELPDQLKGYIDSRIDDIEKKQLTYDSVKILIRDNNNEIDQQIMFSVRQVFESDTRITDLNNLLNAEIEKNKRLEKTLDDLYTRIEKLEKKEMINITVHDNVSDKPQVLVDTNEIKISGIDSVSDASDRHTPLFVLSNSQNVHKLKKIIEAAVELKEQYHVVLSDDVGNSVYFKTVDNLVKKLNKLADECSDDESEPSSIAGDLVKIINATVVKNFANLKLHDVVDKFLIGCGMEKRILDVGKKLSDDDLELIGDIPLDIPVQTAEQHNTIIQKTHDAYIIYYKDEDGLSYRIISGQYSIGKFVR